MSLPFDVFVLILEHLPLPYACRPRIQTQSLNKDIDSSELNALFNCSLANRELNRAAGKVLYRSVRLHFRYPNIGNINFASRFHQSESDASGSSWKAWNGELAYDIGGVGQDDEKDYGLPHEPHPFLSVLLHRSLNPIHTYVQHLHVTGHLSTLPPGLTSNRLPDLLADAIRLLTSGSEVRLQSLRFTPEQCHPETFTKSLRVLSELAESYEKSEDLESCLHELHLNQFAFDDADKVGLLTRIGSKRGLRLRKLTLENPTRVLLQRLVGSTDESNDAKTETRTDAKEGWLYRLQHDLLELHFINNCGSITPGVLRSFTPYLYNVEHLTLGLSYSLADKDVFGVLTKLANLKKAGLRWYLQLNSPPPSAFIADWPLRELEWLKVRYSSLSLQPVLPRALLRDHVHLHQPVGRSTEAKSGPADECPLCAWVEKVTAGSPNLKEAIFVDEDDDGENEIDSENGLDEIDEVNEGNDSEDDEDETNQIRRVTWIMREAGMGEPSLGNILEEDEEGKIESEE